MHLGYSIHYSSLSLLSLRLWHDARPGAGEDVKLIKQPNGWTCAAACVCMLTGTELEDFYRFCGHDGGECVPVTAQHWQGVRCFDRKEVVRYLLEHDLFLGTGCAGPGLDFHPLKEILTIHVDWEMQDVLLSVKSGPNGEGLHQILWSRELKRIVDPQFPEKQCSLQDYEFVECWPVVKVL